MVAEWLQLRRSSSSEAEHAAGMVVGRHAQRVAKQCERAGSSLMCGLRGGASDEYSIPVIFLTKDEIERRAAERKKEEERTKAEEEAKERERAKEGQEGWEKEKRRRRREEKTGEGKPDDVAAPPPPPRSRDEWRPADESDAAERDAAAKAEALERALRNVRTWDCPEDCPSCLVTGVTYSRSARAVQVCGGSPTVGTAMILWYCSVVLTCESEL